MRIACIRGARSEMIDFAAAREAMVDRNVRPSDVTRYPIISAMLRIPREEFVPEAMRAVAYFGEHVPLAPGRVLLDPRTFAKMLEAADVQPGDLVLDIGCGYGYSSAIVARMAEAVVALEEHAEMAVEAEALLARHSVDNAILQEGGLAGGAPNHGPYDLILIEGGAGSIPPAITDQLKTGGRILALLMEAEGFGRMQLGLRAAGGITWRRVFEAAAPVLPGFERRKQFEF